MQLPLAVPDRRLRRASDPRAPIARVVRQAEAPQRNFDLRLTAAMRIEADRDQNHVRPSGDCFA